MKPRLPLLFLCTLLVLQLPACSRMVFKQTIPQGTIFDSDAVEQLEIGMTKKQVEFLMGYPILDDPFLKDQWKYIHLVNSPGLKPYKLDLTLHFKNKKLVKITGDRNKLMRANKTDADKPQEDKSS